MNYLESVVSDEAASTICSAMKSGSISFDSKTHSIDGEIAERVLRRTGMFSPNETLLSEDGRVIRSLSIAPSLKDKVREVKKEGFKSSEDWTALKERIVSRMPQEVVELIKAEFGG